MPNVRRHSKCELFIADGHDKISGLVAGDRSPKELVLRVESILRRLPAPKESVSPKLHLDDIPLTSESLRGCTGRRLRANGARDLQA